MNTKRQPTMVDVAREAGVALGTVSKVVNRQKVGEEYRQKVEQAIERLGYQVNQSGRVLRTDQTNTIAVIIPNTIHPFFALLVHHLNLELEKRGYRMLLCFTEGSSSREMEFIQMAQQDRVDGIIALTYTPELIIPEGIPFVTIDRFFSESVPCIASDNFGGGWLAAVKLQELGCSHVAVLKHGSRLPSETNKRKDGFVSACIEHGLPFNAFELLPEDPEPSLKTFVMEHVSNGRCEFDGLFVSTDLLAWKLAKMLRQEGIRIPEDVQIIGFDGIRMFGKEEYIVSTIVQPVQEIAETCVSTVLSRDHASTPSLICLPVSYAWGGTTRQ